MRIRATLLAAIALLSHHAGAQATPTRVDLTGPFVHAGGLVGSVTGEAGPAGESHAGGGWSAGGGVSLTRSFALVGNYTIFNFRDADATASSPMEHLEVGLRLRVGGVRSPAVFYVDGGGALRHTSLSSSRVFGGTPPPNIGASVDVEGYAGWFGPGLQIYFGRRVAGEVNVAWAWGEFSRARVQGNKLDIASPIGLTTLRMRLGLVATIF